MRAAIYFPLWLLSINRIYCTIAPDNKAKPKPSKILTGPSEQSVFDLDLITHEPLAKDIIVHNGAYYKDTTLRHFNGTVLGYITPWNSHGYDVAKIFTKKFDIIAPVWLQIVPSAEGYALAGTHDIDGGWLSDLRRKGKIHNHVVQFYPRIIFDHFSDRDIRRMLRDDTSWDQINELLIQSCKEHGFNGIVLELWSQLAGRVDEQFLYAFIIQMAKDLQKQQIQFVLVIPPKRKGITYIFSTEHMDKLYKYVNAFSLMTYDYSNVQRPGANAPLYWIRQAIEELAPEGCHDQAVKRSKILMGLNMYGNDYTPDGGGPIVYSRYLELLKYVKKHLTFDEYDVENFFEIKTNTGRHIVFYPTLHSIYERIKLAQELGVGISIWELGQGLDYFYDLF